VHRRMLARRPHVFCSRGLTPRRDCPRAALHIKHWGQTYLRAHKSHGGHGAAFNAELSDVEFFKQLRDDVYAADFVVVHGAEEQQARAGSRPWHRSGAKVAGALLGRRPACSS